MYSGSLQKLNGDHEIMAQLMATLRGFVKFYEIDQYLCEVGLLIGITVDRVGTLPSFRFNHQQYKSQISQQFEPWVCATRAQTGNHDSQMNKCKSCFMKKEKNFPTIMFHENGGGNL